MESGGLLTILSTFYVWNWRGSGKVLRRLLIAPCFLCHTGHYGPLPYFYAVK